MLRRLAVIAAAMAAVTALVAGPAIAASAQAPPPGTIQADLQCGPLISDLTVNVTSGSPDTSYTVSVLGISLGTFETNALGDATAQLPVADSLLGTLTGILPIIVADGTSGVSVPVGDACGLLGSLTGRLSGLTGSPAGLPL